MAVSLILLGCLAAAQAADVTTLKPTTEPVVDRTGSVLDAIRIARDPSSAIQAYAHAIATEPGSIGAIEQTYVHRMVELGVPEMADAQAQDLVTRGGAVDPLAQAVSGYMAAAHGQVGPGAAQLKSAMAAAPDDPFILRTAAQIVAWYDSQTDRSALTKDDTQNIEWLRTTAQHKDEFAKAYRDALQRNKAAPATAGATPPTSQDTQTYGPENPPVDVATADAGPYQGYYYAGASYSYPYYYPAYSYCYDHYNYPCNPYWYGGYWGGYWGHTWWPSHNCIIIHDHAFSDHLHAHDLRADIERQRSRTAGDAFRSAGGSFRDGRNDSVSSPVFVPSVTTSGDRGQRFVRGGSTAADTGSRGSSTAGRRTFSDFSDARAVGPQPSGSAASASSSGDSSRGSSSAGSSRGSSSSDSSRGSSSAGSSRGSSSSGSSSARSAPSPSRGGGDGGSSGGGGSRSSSSSSSSSSGSSRGSSSSSSSSGGGSGRR